MNELTVDNIDGLIERAIKESKEIELKNADNLMYSNPARRKLKSLYIAKVYLDRGHDVDWHMHGLIVNDKFIVAPKSLKWRVQGRGKWYRYSEKKFIKVLEDK